MSESPRRQRANVCEWMYLALHGNPGESAAKERTAVDMAERERRTQQERRDNSDWS